VKLVLDTNVLVAAFITHGVCNELLEHCALHHQIILSSHIMEEFRRVLTRKFTFSQHEVEEANPLKSE
jgi:predicted nucleic acid-binding protein